MSSEANENWQALCETVESVRQRDRVPGMALGVLHKDQTFTTGFGVTNVDHPLDVTDETWFQVGSISKTFAATALMRLCEAGKVDLDALVRTYLPEWGVADEETSARTTVRHLLNHTGGWEGDYFRHTGQGDDALAKYMEIMKEIPQLAPLGTVWSYNNAGFAVVGRIIEVLTEKTFEAALEELVLEPLKLGDSYLDHADVMVHRFVTGHNRVDGEVRIARPWPLPRYAWAAGGVMCHIKELLSYAAFHLGDGSVPGGERLLKPETMKAMRTPQARMWGDAEAMGLSWFMKNTPDLAQIWHGGGTTGQVCMLHMVPDRSFAVGLLTNGSHGRDLLRTAVRSALKIFLGYDAEELKPMGASEDDLATFAGNYWRPYAEMELGMLGGRLVCQHIPKAGFPTEDTPAPPASQPWALDLCEKDRLIVLEGEIKDAPVDVLRKPDGTLGWLRLGGRIYVRQEDT
jgi:CubicO group peptidase (beta-lactamase class C family)